MKEMDTDIFNLSDEQPAPLRGSLLVARPTVGDPCFGRSVIAMMHHDTDGSMGLILNRITNLCLSDVLDDMELSEKIPVYLGGPVNPELMFYIHDLGPDVIADATKVTDGLYLGGDGDSMKAYLSSGAPIEGHVRFFVGYSGWDAGQLMEEIRRHDWVVLDGDNREMMLHWRHEGMWDEAVSRFGDRYRLWRNWPLEPTDN